MKDWNEIKAWRKSRRVELIAAREAMSTEQRKSCNDSITASLEAGIPVSAGAVVGFCWPHRGEFDARYAVRHWRDLGATAALPAVVDKKGPLEFRRWWPGAPMKPAVYDIPVPDGTGVVAPDVAIVPMNGFDAQGYRLGYGGGYFDRTLAALDRRVLAIGVTFDALKLDTIHPQPHDIPMDFVVTESAIYAAAGEPLEAIGVEEARERYHRLLLAKRLPRAAFPDSGLSSPVCYAEQFPDYFSGGGQVP